MTAGQSLADGAAGVALLHMETGNWPSAHAALQEATVDGVSVAEGASLYYGAPALAFVLATSDRLSLARARAVAIAGTATVTRHLLERAHRRIDKQQQPAYAEYDLIRGLTGLGVVLRRVGEPDLLRDVLTYLVRLTEPIGALPGWWCSHGPDRTQPGPVGGHSNHGIAHGISGPLALLALALNDGITTDGHEAAITRICGWLDVWQRRTSSGPWWPQTITLDALRHHAPGQRSPGRPSWCYGTPGIARAQQLAGLALGDRARQHRAESAFTACVSDPAQTGQFTDRTICHGTAGLIATARRIAADALTPVPLEPLQRLHRQSPAADNEPAGFLDGAAGVALATAKNIATTWDACLLLS